MGISDLVLLFNYATEGVFLDEKAFKNSGYDYWNGPPAPLKEAWLKFFRAHTARIANLNPNFRVTPIPEEQSTIVQVSRFVLV